MPLLVAGDRATPRNTTYMQLHLYIIYRHQAISLLESYPLYILLLIIILFFNFERLGATHKTRHNVLHVLTPSLLVDKDQPVHHTHSPPRFTGSSRPKVVSFHSPQTTPTYKIKVLLSAITGLIYYNCKHSNHVDLLVLLSLYISSIPSLTPLINPTPPIIQSLPLVSLHRSPVVFHRITIMNNSIINPHSFCSFFTSFSTFLYYIILCGLLCGTHEDREMECEGSVEGCVSTTTSLIHLGTSLHQQLHHPCCFSLHLLPLPPSKLS